MQDFIQVGQTHFEWFVINIISSIMLIGVGFGLLMYVIKTVRERKKKNQMPKDESVGFMVFVGIMGTFVLIAGIIWPFINNGK